MTAHDAGRPSRLARVIAAPSLALLSFGCLLPFLTEVDALRLSVSASQVIGVYGTQFIFLAIVAGVVLILAIIADKAINGLVSTRRHPRSNRSIEWISRALFFGITFTAAKTLVTALVASVGPDISAWPWTALIGIAVVVLSSVEPVSTRLFDSLTDFARMLAIAGIATTPFALVPLTSSTPTTARIAVAERPNILLITLDALSARQMSLYGAPQPTTPSIDRFAETALVFDHAYAGANFTTAGINTLLTGEYPSQHRSLQLLSQPMASSRAQSIPAMLKQAGYYTGYVVSNPHAGPMRNGYQPYFDFGVGDAWRGRYGVCEDRFVPFLPYNCFFTSPFIKRIVAQLSPWAVGNNEYDPELMMRGIRQFLGTRPHRPFFLWAHFFQPHEPFAAPAPWLGAFDPSPLARDAATSVQTYGFNAAVQSPATTRILQARYRESLAWVDRSVGRLIADAVAAAGSDLLVIVTADHGESFSDSWGGHAGALLNEDVIHIPLIVRLPRQAQGRRLAVVASQTDIRSIIEAALRGFDADRLAQLIDARRNAEPAMSMAFIDNPHLESLEHGSIAAIGPNWKYVRYIGGFQMPQGKVFEQMTPLTTPAVASGEQAMLRRAVDRHLRRWGAAVRETP